MFSDAARLHPFRVSMKRAERQWVCGTCRNLGDIFSRCKTVRMCLLLETFFIIYWATWDYCQMTCDVKVKCSVCVRRTIYIEPARQKQKEKLEKYKMIGLDKERCITHSRFQKFSPQLNKFSTEIVHFVGYNHRAALTHGIMLILWSHFTLPNIWRKGWIAWDDSVSLVTSIFRNE